MAIENQNPGTGREPMVAVMASDPERNKLKQRFNTMELRFPTRIQRQIWHNGLALVLLWTSVEAVSLLKGGTPS